MHISPEDIRTIGKGLVRPEGVMATDDGCVWAADGRGHVARISPEGKVTLIGSLGGVPNGICFDDQGHCIIANIGSGEVQGLDPKAGTHFVLVRAADGKVISSPNFPFWDHHGRLWVSNSTYRRDVEVALQHPAPDGCLVLFKNNVAKVVAEGIFFANGVALDAEERYVFVAETMKRRVLRYPITHDDGLGHPEVYGPTFLGKLGFPDGIAFDEAGNLWVTLPMQNAIGYIDPHGAFHIAVEDTTGKVIRQPANICFGGPDRKTAYIGSLGGENIPFFRVPHKGLRLVHQSP